MKILTILILLFNFFTFSVNAKVDFEKPFKDCNLEGSITIYDYNKKEWIVSNKNDSYKETLPASTFKIINFLIALESKVIKDENDVIKWVGKVDESIYGHRPEIYHDMTIKEAFEVSSGWVFIELAKKIGKKNYLHYLKESYYGNMNLSAKGDDFWNLGRFGISPHNQVTFLVDFYEYKLPFSKRNIDIVKKVMINTKNDDFILRAKTGWTRPELDDIGWWVGYVEKKDNLYFFSTRLIKKRSTINKNFGDCRKSITTKILKDMKILN